MVRGIRVLIAGESWLTLSIHSKGFDYFVSTDYEEGIKWLKEALEKQGIQVDYLPNHKAGREFPLSIKELKRYDVIFLSDIGANTLLIHPDTFQKFQPTPNRLKLIQDYVKQGGGFAMIGGYLSFQGIEGKARYHGTPIEEILPVELSPYDDRIEIPEGFRPIIIEPDHPILADIPQRWPIFLGYNKVMPKSKGIAKILLEYNKHPFLTISSYGNGRTAAFASDCAPHWGSLEFINWNCYGIFWNNLVRWLAGG